MSREDLSNFIKAAERSFTLRKELKNCTDQQKIIKLALDYGFLINPIDLETSSASEELAEWFNISKIPPIKKHNY